MMLGAAPRSIKFYYRLLGCSVKLFECRLLLSASDQNTETDASIIDFPSELYTNMPSFAKKNDQSTSLNGNPKQMLEMRQKRNDRAKDFDNSRNAFMETAISVQYSAKPYNTITRYQSLNDLTNHFCVNGSREKVAVRSARSMSSLEHIGSTAKQQYRTRPAYHCTRESHQVERLKLKVKRLHSELREAQKLIGYLSGQDEKRTVDNLQQEKFLYDAVMEKRNNSSNNISSYATCDEVAAVIKKFTLLYDKDRTEILKALDQLPEFHGSEELQHKTVLSIIVLTYRSVQESVERRRQLIFEILGDEICDDAENASLDTALYRYMSRKAKYEYGIANAKEVTSKIWNALYDFPSLRTCAAFNKFILDCVAVAWDLVAGIDGKSPRMCIEYESRQFDACKHQRYIASSNIQSNTVQQYLWPAVLDRSTGACLCKAVVIT